MKHKLIIRASDVGSVMTEPRSKTEQASQSALKVLQEMALFDKYGIQREFSSMQTSKGIELEPLAIDICKNVLGWFDVSETKTRMINDYITGEPDVLTPTVLADIKCSFSADTFPWFEKELKNKDYYYQMQSYMWLSNKNESELVYILLTTPERMVLDLINKEAWKMLPDPKFENYSQDEIFDIAENKIRSKHNFEQIPIEKRIRKYVIKKDDHVINRIIERIEKLTPIYNNLIESI
jgi:hypothetical protein